MQLKSYKDSKIISESVGESELKSVLVVVVGKSEVMVSEI